MTDLVDPETLQLVVTNLALGLVCAILLAIVLIGIAVQLIGRRDTRGPDEASPPKREPRHPGRTLMDQRDELPDGWPPIPEKRREACSTTRY